MALIDLHSSRIVHCGIKPSRIRFFPSEHRWKLLNLDSAVITGQVTEIGAASSVKYAAPEIIKAQVSGRNKMIVETSADMWSVGIILFEIMSGMP